MELFGKGMVIVLRDSVPTGTRWIADMKSSRGSAGASREPRRAVDERWTLLNVVVAWSTGFAPARVGRGILIGIRRFCCKSESILLRNYPLHICHPSFKVTRNGRIPLSSVFTNKRAKTMATRGSPATGPLGGIHLILLVHAQPSQQ